MLAIYLICCRVKGLWIHLPLRALICLFWFSGGSPRLMEAVNRRTRQKRENIIQKNQESNFLAQLNIKVLYVIIPYHTIYTSYYKPTTVFKFGYNLISGCGVNCNFKILVPLIEIGTNKIVHVNGPKNMWPRQSGSKNIN